MFFFLSSSSIFYFIGLVQDTKQKRKRSGKIENNLGKTVNVSHHVYRCSSGLSKRFEDLQWLKQLGI